MNRSSKWMIPLAFAVLLAVTGSFLAPAQTGQARSAAATPKPKQIVYLDANGQILVDSFQGNQPLRLWQSFEDNGWNNIAVGDFNGDGSKEIVATRFNSNCICGVLQGFSPASGNTWTPTESLDYFSGKRYHLMAVGDFRGLNRDQLAISFTSSSSGFTYESVVVYTWDAAGNLVGDPIQVLQNGGTLSSLAAGDINHDNIADIVYTGKGDDNKSLVMISGGTGSGALKDPPFFHSTDFCCQWFAVQVGNMDKDPDGQDTDHKGLELVLTRDAPPPAHSVDLEFWNSGDDKLKNWDSTLDYSFYPGFPAVALGDADGDVGHDDEIFALRVPADSNQAWLVMLNPAGPSIRDFEQAGGPYWNQWRRVVAGDVTGDGLADAVVLRTGGYRVYTSVAANNNFVDVPSSTGLLNTAIVVANLGFNFAASPSSFNFSFNASQYFNTGVGFINLSGGASSGTLTYEATVVNGGQWLSLDKTSGTVPGAIELRVKASSAPVGTSTAQISIVARSGTTQVGQSTIPVVVVVGDPTFTVGPKSVSLIYDKSNPANSPVLSSDVQVLRPPAGNNAPIPPVAWTASVTTPGATWLKISPTQGSTPGTLTLSLDQANVPALPGMYSANVQVTPSDPVFSRTIAVTLYVWNQSHRYGWPTITKLYSSY